MYVQKLICMGIVYSQRDVIYCKYTQALYYYYLIYQLGTGRDTQKALACRARLPKAMGTY